jgi:hypothetical protein
MTELCGPFTPDQKQFLHWESSEYFLFQSWKTFNTFGLSTAVLTSIITGYSLYALFTLKSKLLRNTQTDLSDLTDPSEQDPLLGSQSRSRSILKIIKKQTIKACIDGTHALTAIVSILAVMTFNLYIISSLVFGFMLASFTLHEMQ